jgi:MYXO-CTERM domain-containing protein
MKTRTLFTLAGVGAPLILAGSTQAAFTGVKAVLKENTFALTYNIYATFDQRPGDFVFAVAGTPLAPLNINVRGGTFYQNQFGGNKAPNSALFAVFPSLQFDTFVTIGKKTSAGDATGLAPGFPGFGPDRLVMDNSGWFITPDDPQGQPNANGQVLLAQLSTQDGTGFFGTILIGGFSNGVDFQTVVSFDTQDQQAPAPGALALLGAAGLLGYRRRRR